MGDGMYAALSGAVAQERAIELVADNLANVSTTGFKGSQLSFKEVLMQKSDTPNSTVQTEALASVIDFSQGALRTTHNPLDLALMGPGFFSVQTPEGERYTRNGSFHLDAKGHLLTNEGYGVLGKDGPIRLPVDGSLEFDEHGVVWLDGSAINRLRTVNFADPQSLERQGGALWRGREPTVVDAPIRSGALENSNVSAVHTMNQLIIVHRSYEIYHRAMEMMRNTDHKVSEVG